MEESKYLYAIKSYIDKMPSLPTTVSKILEICNDPKTSPADLNRIISVDPVLMGKVLKLINSAYYGLSQEITSLVRAIIMLGINTVKNLALSTAVLSTLSSSNNFHALNMEGFWRHSLCVGVTSKLIALQRKVDKKNIEEYFIAGLLHDIGKIPLNNRLATQYIATMEVSDRNHLSLNKAEDKTLQINHAAVGKLIVENWKLGDDICDAISYHHSVEEYEGPNEEILYSVVLANYFANMNEIGFSGDRYPERMIPAVVDRLGISMDFLEDEMEFRVNDEIEKARVFLQLAG